MYINFKTAAELTKKIIEAYEKKCKNDPRKLLINLAKEFEEKGIIKQLQKNITKKIWSGKIRNIYEVLEASGSMIIVKNIDSNDLINKLRIFNKELVDKVLKNEKFEEKIEIIQQLNKELVKEGSKYKFYYAFLYRVEENGKINRSAGDSVILYLTDDQAKFLESKKEIFFMITDFLPKMPKEKIDDYINIFEKIGLLKHINKNRLEKIKKRLYEDPDINDQFDILVNLPDVITVIDVEANTDTPYKDALEELSKISHGYFNITDIVDNYDYDKKTKISFKFNNKKYSTTVTNSGDFIDLASLFELVDKALKDNKVPGEFYIVDIDTGQVSWVLFLTKNQLKRFKELKPFPIIY